jgi:hypothetical protein
MAFMDHDARSFDQTIQIVQRHTKFNTIDILEKFNISSHKKAKMNILLCWMMSMHVVHLIFNLKWNMHSKWVGGKVTKFSTCFLQLREEKRTQLISMKRSGMFTSKRTMTDLIFS